jgi:hypothetical protein
MSINCVKCGKEKDLCEMRLINSKFRHISWFYADAYGLSIDDIKRRAHCPACVYKLEKLFAMLEKMNERQQQ